MGVSLKTENEEYTGKITQIPGSEGGRRGFTCTCQQGLTWRVPRQPSARLTHGLKRATALWLLRCSVFRETPMAFFYYYFKELNCYEFSKRPNSRVHQEHKRSLGTLRRVVFLIIAHFSPRINPSTVRLAAVHGPLGPGRTKQLGVVS
jgi:hypothetical protein